MPTGKRWRAPRIIQRVSSFVVSKRMKLTAAIAMVTQFLSASMSERNGGRDQQARARNHDRLEDRLYAWMLHTPVRRNGPAG